MMKFSYMMGSLYKNYILSFCIVCCASCTLFSCYQYDRLNQVRFTEKGGYINTPDTSFHPKINQTPTSLVEVSIVYFDFNAYLLTNQNKTSLQAFINNLDTNEQYYLEGNTDNVGSDDYNYQLSQKRANSVKNYLVELGMNPNQLIVLAKGEHNPIADNQTAPEKNRRVSIYQKK